MHYRSTRAGSESGVTDLLEGQYSTEGGYIGDDDDFAKGLKKIFPSAKITTPMSFREVIEINGEEVDLTRPKAEVEARIRQLVKIGENKKKSENKTSSNKTSSNKSTGAMSEEAYQKLLEEAGAN
jgi:hypothetical protein